MKRIASVLLALAASSAAFAAAPKKTMLVVTVSTGFRHSSIETTEKVLRQFAAKTGEFNLISTMDHPDYPDYATGAGFFGTQVGDGTPGQVTYIRKLNDRVQSPLLPLSDAVTKARTELAATSLALPANQKAIAAAAKKVSDAELAFAAAKADAFAKLQASDNRLTPQQVLVLQGKAAAAPAVRMSFAPQVGAATPQQQKAIQAANASQRFVELEAAAVAARRELGGALTDSKEKLAAKAAAVAAAEQNLADARATELARIQTTAGKIQPAVLKTLVSRFALANPDDGGAKVMQDVLSVSALKNYDGVFFASTTGILPFPDLDGFIGWVRNGGAWLGNHAASDSMHGVSKYYDMMGGEFAGHGSQTRETMTVVDPKNPIGAAIGTTLTVHDEMYTFENENFDYSRVHAILDFTQSLNDGLHSNVGAPGHWPSIWIKDFGKGRVFFSALGHREDVIDPTWGTPATRMNPPEVAQAYQRMLLEGVRYGLGITKLDATPQAKVPTPAGAPGHSYRVSRGNGGTNPPLNMDVAP